MPKCIAKGCRAPVNGLKVYYLPNGITDTQRLRKWLDVTGNEHISLVEAEEFRKLRKYAVCENHFSDDAFENLMRYNMVGGRKILKKDAIPTLNLCEKITCKSKSTLELYNAEPPISHGILTIRTVDISSDDYNDTFEISVPKLTSKLSCSDNNLTYAETLPSITSISTDNDTAASFGLPIPPTFLDLHNCTHSAKVEVVQPSHVKHSIQFHSVPYSQQANAMQRISHGTQTESFTEDVGIQVIPSKKNASTSYDIKYILSPDPLVTSSLV